MSGLFTKDIVVLDVTSRLISAIVGVKKAQSVFGIKSIVETEQPGYADGEWFDKNETLQAAEQALSQAMVAANSRAKRLFIGVPSEFVLVVSKHVSVRLDRRRRIADDDIDFLLRKGNDFYLSDFIVVNTSAVYFAINGDEKLYSDVRGMYADSVDACVSYVLAERRFVNMFDGVADKLGFKDVRYIASNWAECVALLDNEQRENTYVLIDVGYLSSSVSIAKGEGVLDMKSFSLGGAHISADICEALDVPFEYAEEAKSLVDINLNYSDGKWLVHRDEQEIMACEVVPIVKGRLDVFASVISSIIDGFAENTSSYLPIYLTGEGIASMRGARKYLSEKIGKNIELVTPKLPGFVKAEDSSKTALLLMADTLYKEGIGGMIKSIFNGGKK
ncbi:MAG: hypothetical protein NC303_00015 [Firmicutes bacterium]|nr:hypothetical protein [Bacillota bacterium]MCM1394446.1 hypothetical protein [[Eubacterium] siraeum]